ncbi:MAG: vgr related protein [Pseudomonadota bacterium]
MTSRALTDGETALARSVFGDAIDYARVRIHQRKWAFFQPRGVVMAPDGGIWFHPHGGRYCPDFCTGSIDAQGLFIHEMTHVWQRQKGIYLPLARHPWCRYDYALKPGQRFEKYGLEQQAEIVRHAFLLREGHSVAGAPPFSQYESVLPF